MNTLFFRSFIKSGLMTCDLFVFKLNKKLNIIENKNKIIDTK
ncbi:hypothetical protein SALWKB2_0448 [Snodgrassella alvi wkB2]|nr:hypothetical protein SALWKB2_0448 [Snodgrassella alvi wkB2]